MVELQPLIVKDGGAIATIMINNPEKMNALTEDCLRKITETFQLMTDRQDIRVVVLRGVGDQAFSAGADISSLPDRQYDMATERDLTIEQTVNAIRKYPFPVIAMLNGFTIGAGFILAMACDIRIGADHLRMGHPTSRMGLIPSYKWLQHYISIFGFGRAMELVLTGRQYNSRECLEMDLVNHIVEKKDLETYTYDLAGEVARNAPLSIQGTKYIMNRLLDNPIPDDNDLESFRSWSERAVKSDDHAEAKLAFTEKRKPVFKGR